MIELNSEHFSTVLPLYRETGRCFPLISAVIQNLQQGQIFADSAVSPTSALVFSKFGFMQIIGKQDNYNFNDSLVFAFQNSNQIPLQYVMWYDPPLFWQQKLEQLPPDVVKIRGRIRFEFHPERAAWYLNQKIAIPDNYELSKLSLELIDKTDKFKLNISSRFWASNEEVVEKANGVCLINNGEIASLCYAACVCDGLAEVDIVTDPDYRGKGLATLVAQQFIVNCLSNNLVPAWDCFDYNSGSCRVASSLGFIEKYRYKFLSFSTFR